MWGFREINVDATAKRVRNYFDEYYPRLERMSGQSLQSTVISDMPRISPVGNAIESQVQERVWAGSVLDATAKAIESCDLDSRIILISKYINKKPDWKTQQAINCERTRFYAKLKTACNQFADAFEVEAALLFDDKSNDLHVYVKY